MSYLKKYPFSEIKVDHSFVRGITLDPGHAELCKAIIAMAKSPQLEVAGEGVETREQLEFLKLHGAGKVQGYYFSKLIS